MPQLRRKGSSKRVKRSWHKLSSVLLSLPTIHS
uniref:Uncharacterized protein n=1 Tax=Anguilla anguilla TaxID=7936 RepID=A0A0E9QE70_ANGAN